MRLSITSPPSAEQVSKVRVLMNAAVLKLAAEVNANGAEGVDLVRVVRNTMNDIEKAISGREAPEKTLRMVAAAVAMVGCTCEVVT